MFENAVERRSVVTVLLVPDFKLREKVAELCGEKVNWSVFSDESRSLVMLEGTKAERSKIETELSKYYSEVLIREGNDAFPRDLIHVLNKKKMKLCTAESCTGGLIAKLLTDVAGSSAVFWGGFITYDNDAKKRILGVSKNCLEEFGAVSLETVREMAFGAMERSGADCSLAISGIAGPGGGSPEKPVGTVCIGACLKDGLFCGKRFQFKGSRERIRTLSAHFALILLESLIVKSECLDMDIPYDYI